MSTNTQRISASVEGAALAHKIVTQIVRETTLAPDDFLKSNGQRKRRLEMPRPSHGNSRPEHTTRRAAVPGSYRASATACATSDLHIRTGMRLPRTVSPAAQPKCSFQRRRRCVSWRAGSLVPYRHQAVSYRRPAAKRLVEMVVQEYRDQHDDKAPANCSSTQNRISPTRNGKDSSAVHLLKLTSLACRFRTRRTR